jgi:hypothetical protein
MKTPDEGGNRPRAFTAEEARQQLYRIMRGYCAYWSAIATDPRQAARAPKTEKERMEALCFSLLNILDGGNGGLPAFDLVLAPHPEDRAFQQAQGACWYEPGMVINPVEMHEEWSRLDDASG